MRLQAEIRKKIISQGCFCAENRPPVKFSEIGLPAYFVTDEGEKLFRKVSLSEAIGVINAPDRQTFTPDYPVYKVDRMNTTYRTWRP